jgi:hypothetical protein
MSVVRLRGRSRRDALVIALESIDCRCTARLASEFRNPDRPDLAVQIHLLPDAFSGRIGEKDGRPLFGQREATRRHGRPVRRRMRPQVDRTDRTHDGRRSLVPAELRLGVEFDVTRTGAYAYCPNCGRLNLIPSSAERSALLTRRC